ncbi:TlpA disulfide reductase family protein [Chitinophaga sp. S165]|uniref:TlpA family protein disulfide reductase n=1 Tax=Chitinophaga sp. S165 TaxID=2135462 RepID=UPI000D70F1E7|nr:TlpA disulfide reductase family protein [Chitinophaga sp. S165]PWV48803.1 thiol-disulfide isomerase/thioredoxin [Chitinophaga sp. S165]
MFRYLFVLLLTVLSYSPSLSQDRAPAAKYQIEGTALDVGAVVPDFRLRQVLNHKDEEVTLSEFRGKAILIDFWASHCQPCFAQFPKLKDIQDKYNEHLQVITITNDSLRTVTELFRNIGYKGFSLLTATAGPNNTNDSLFFAFPHKYIPFYVWIDRTGVLKALTSYEALTENNIALLINGGSLDTIIGRRENIVSEAEHPAVYFYQESNIAEKMMLNDSINGLISYSMLTGYNKKYPPSCAFDRGGIYAYRRIRVWNLPLLTMFRLAYGKIGKDIDGQELLSVPRVFFNIKDEKIAQKLEVNFSKPPETTGDLYCYDLISDEAGEQVLKNRMQEDLYKYFGVRSNIVRRRVACYVLSLKDSSKLKTAGGDSYAKANLYFLELKNTPFSRLMDYIRSYNEGSKAERYSGLESSIIIDETGFTGNIDISITAKMNDVNALNLALSRYGLVLQKGERWIDILLLEDAVVNSLSRK